MTRASRVDPLDEIDLQLLELLRQDGRASNRSLARSVGLSDATITNRLRRLRDAGVMSVTVALDWQAAGFCWESYLAIEVEGRVPRDVAGEISRLREVHSVALTFGPADLSVHVLAPDRECLARLLTETIPSISGVRRVTSDLVLDVIQFRWSMARLPDSTGPDLWFPDPVVPIDALDRKIIELLAQDGRRSNREIARRLDVSDGTVRSRLRRVEEADLVRIVAQTDPIALGEFDAVAFVGIETMGGRARAIAAHCAELPQVQTCSLMMGRHDIWLVVATSTRRELNALVAEHVRSLEGVRSTETVEAVEVVSHSHHWVRLL